MCKHDAAYRNLKKRRRNEEAACSKRHTGVWALRLRPQDVQSLERNFGLDGSFDLDVLDTELDKDCASD